MRYIHAPYFASVEKCRDAYHTVDLYLRVKGESVVREIQATESVECESRLKGPAVYFSIKSVFIQN